MSKRILVVDDTPIIRDLLQTKLEQDGYEVTTAVNGKEGLEKALGDIPTLIISDVLMPEMDGYAFYKELRSNEVTANIPVIILTARTKMEDSFAVVGVNSFVSKEVAAEVLLAEIDKEVTRLLSEIEDSSVETYQAKSDISTPDEAVDNQKAEPVKTESKDKSESPSQPAGTTFATPEGHSDEMNAVKTEVVLFGTNNEIVKTMTKQLKDENCKVTVVIDENEILPQVSEVDPDIVLLQLKTDLILPLDEITYSLSELIKEKAKEFGLDSASFHILVYKLEEDKSGVDSYGDDLTEIDNILERCSEFWDIQYIGGYTSLTFPSKIRKYTR